MLPKILIVADGQGEVYAPAFKKAFADLGCLVETFTWKEYFHHYQYHDRYPVARGLFRSLYFRFQNKYIVGPAVRKINFDLVRLCELVDPDLVFILRGTHIFPGTIAKIKESIDCRIFSYNNDNPFVKGPSFGLWRFFKRSIPLFDHVFAYRIQDVEGYKKFGANNVSLLRSCFIEERNFPIRDLRSSKYSCDVVFVGHFENDGRDVSIKHLLSNNIDVRVYGPGWEKSRYFSFFNKKRCIYGPAWKDYNLILNSSKIALVFLSRLNRDTYTRRCFEIPATKTFMLSEPSEELKCDFFPPGVGAEYFTDKEELLEKVRFYLGHAEARRRVADAGYEIVVGHRHEIKDRVRTVLSCYFALSGEGVMDRKKEFEGEF